MNSAVSLRDPSGLFYQKDSLRRSIITAYWIVIILALPLWWSTTSIHRLSLPSSRVQEQTRWHLQLPITICLESNSSELIRRQLGFALELSASENPVRWKGISLKVIGQTECTSESNSYTIIPYNGSPSIIGRRLYFPLHEVDAIPRLADTITSLVVPYSSLADPDRRVAQYSPRYRLAFSLLNEDAAAGDGVRLWNIQRSLTTHLKPILRYLNDLHNFTIESQVQFHAPLAFSPLALQDTYAVSPEDLSVFVNSAEWTLSSSSSNDPVLHFVLFIPSPLHRPLRILTKDGGLSPSNAFMLPQWGGIVIHNPRTLSNNQLPIHDLDTIFSAFADQLLALLGVPALPSSLTCNSIDSKPLISDWQLDALLRRRTLENASGSQDTLLSIIKLVNQIDNMPVKEDVRDDVEGALTALTKMYDSLPISLKDTFAYSADSFRLASRAFFNPGMLALLYFPAEHKYAVYTPLFASAVIPLFVAALREISAWRKEVKGRGAAAVSVSNIHPSG